MSKWSLQWIFVYGAAAALTLSCAINYYSEDTTNHWSTRELCLLTLLLSAVFHIAWQKELFESVTQKHKEEIKVQHEALQQEGASVRTLLHLLQQTFYANRELQKDIGRLQETINLCVQEKNNATQKMMRLIVSRSRQACWLKTLILIVVIPSFVCLFKDLINGDVASLYSPPILQSSLSAFLSFVCMLLAFTTIDCRHIPKETSASKRLVMKHNDIQSVKPVCGATYDKMQSVFDELLYSNPKMMRKQMSGLVMDDIQKVADISVPALRNVADISVPTEFTKASWGLFHRPCIRNGDSET